MNNHQIEIKPATLVDLAEEQLMEYIKTKNLRPGDQLPNEAELVQELGVSRSVLREVLSRFKMVGLIESRTRRGMILTEPLIFEGMKRVIDPRIMSQESIINLLGFRIALEVGICADIFRNLTNKDIDELEEIVNMGLAMENNVYTNIGEFSFHTKLYAITRNEIIAQFQDIILPVIKYVKTNQFEYIQEANQELKREGRIVTHMDLFELLKQRDEKGFREAMGQHFAAYRKLIEDYATDEITIPFI